MPKKIQKAISAKDGVIAASKYFTEFNSGYTKGFSVGK